jgi:hypothetical protein
MPSSWNEEDVSRSQKEALLTIEQYLSMIGNGQEFELNVMNDNDLSVSDGLNLWWFGIGEMLNELEDAVNSVQSCTLQPLGCPYHGIYSTCVLFIFH